MRNVFDQYDQPENRLTHALACTLAEDRQQIRPFLRWLGISEIPPLKDLRVLQQQVPGEIVSADDDEVRGLPDLCVFTDEGWCVLFESKVQAKVTAGQLRRHLRTAQRHGYEKPFLVLISVENATGVASTLAATRRWREVYAWFRSRSGKSEWATRLTEFMETFESRMLATGYDIRGTITMFDGLKFDHDNPYTYREGKRLIRLLGDQLRARKELHRLGLDPARGGRSAITGRRSDMVWDYLPLKVASGSSQFTHYPHLTIAIKRPHASAAVTVPNGVKGGFKSKLRRVGYDGFLDLLLTIEQNLRPIIRRSKDSQPVVYATQRHYRTQSSDAVTDARLDVDLRTLAQTKSRVKQQPQWCRAIYEILANKRSNIQLGIEMRFSYKCPIVRSSEAVDLFSGAWIGMKPMLDFVLKK